ncbi:MAG: DUF4239 domain-containing protein [Bacteroidota bacterium]
MAITYHMLQIPTIWLFIIMISSGALFAGTLTFIFRKYIRVKVLRSHNEVTGFLFTAIASFYALLLGFVVFTVWGQLNDTQTNINQEGGSALSLYRDIKFYPDTLDSQKLKTVYLGYVFNVIDEDFPNMEKLKLSSKTPESLNKVFYTLESLNPKNPFQTQLLGEMFHHLNELCTLRELRISAMETEIPPSMWLPIMIGAVITIICAMLLDIEHTRILIGLNSLFGAFIGMILFTIILLDHPFAGSLKIEPKSYMEILKIEMMDNEFLIKQEKFNEKQMKLNNSTK